MANQTIDELIAQVREFIRERDRNKFFRDDAASLLGHLTKAMELQHLLLRKQFDFEHDGTPRRLRKYPNPDHPYWKQFWSYKQIALVVDQYNYDLPGYNSLSATVESDRFDIFHSIIDETTGTELHPYQIEKENTVKRGMIKGVGHGEGRFTFVPGDQIRLLVYPGSFGQPKEIRNMGLRYWRGFPHYSQGKDVVIIRPEFTEAPVKMAAHNALASRRINSPFYQQAGEAMAAIPAVV